MATKRTHQTYQANNAYTDIDQGGEDTPSSQADDSVKVDLPRPNVTVIPKGDESVESLLRRFNREMMRAGVVRRMKELEFYEKPSLRRKRKKEEQRRLKRRTYTSREIEWVEE